MGVAQLFLIVQLVPNRAMHPPQIFKKQFEQILLELKYPNFLFVIHIQFIHNS